MLPVRAATERPRGTSFAGELVLAPLSATGHAVDATAGGRVGRVRVGADARARASAASAPTTAGSCCRTTPIGPRCFERSRRRARRGFSLLTDTRRRSRACSPNAGWQSGVMRTAWEGEPTAIDDGDDDWRFDWRLAIDELELAIA